MSKYIALFLIFALATVAFTAPTRRVNVNAGRAENNIKWWTDGKALIFTSKSFDAIVGKDKYVVVQFCATFSKECEALAPEYDKLAEKYTGNTPARADLIVAKIDGWTFNSLSQTYSVKRFPTIRFFNKGDPTNSDEYNGDLTADKIAEWAENLIKAKSGQPATEQKKPDEPKKEATEVPKTETKQPEAANNQANNNQANNQQQQQQQQQQQEQAKQPEATKENKPVDSEDLKKEFKLVLNTTLLQAQFDEVQKQLNTLKENLERNIADNFKKVDTLSQSLENHKNEFRNLFDSIRGHGDKINQLSNSLNSQKEDIKNAVTSHAENHLTTLKESVNSIKSKVWEKKVEEASGPSFMHNLLWMAIGGAIGGVAVFFLANGGGKKRRSMLD